MPYSFIKIGTAISFSPFSKLILKETAILCRRFESKMVIIHVGEDNELNRTKMNGLFQEVSLEGIDYELVFCQGDPVEQILQATIDFQIDLLVAGGLKKERFWNVFKASVARSLCRRANCSILILTEPKDKGTRFNSIVVNGVDHPKTKKSIKTAIHFASRMQIKDIEVIEEVVASKVKTEVEDDYTCDKATKEREAIYKEEKKKIDAYLKEINLPHIKVSYNCLFGELGYTIGHYTEIKKADLLVMNSPDKELGFWDRIFTHDLEYLLNEMPTNLMIVH